MSCSLYTYLGWWRAEIRRPGFLLLTKRATTKLLWKFSRPYLYSSCFGGASNSPCVNLAILPLPSPQISLRAPSPSSLFIIPSSSPTPILSHSWRCSHPPRLLNKAFPIICPEYLRTLRTYILMIINPNKDEINKFNKITINKLITLNLFNKLKILSLFNFSFESFNKNLIN